MKLRRFATVVVMGVFLGACEGLFTSSECTLIVCTDGLFINLLGAPAVGPYRVELFSATSPAARYVFECPEGRACGSQIFFPDYTPSEVNIRIVAATQATAYRERPTYTRPGDTQCNDCTIGRVSVQFPTSSRASTPI